MVREYERARHRYLEDRYGIEGADRIERSNKKLAGKPPRSGHGPALAEVRHD
jgi:hypothetical protein